MTGALAAFEDPLLTLNEVAELLRVPAPTLRYWRSVGQGPTSFKTGARVVYRTSAVQRYLAEQEAKTSSEHRAPSRSEQSSEGRTPTKAARPSPTTEGIVGDDDRAQQQPWLASDDVRA